MKISKQDALTWFRFFAPYPQRVVFRTKSKKAERHLPLRLVRISCYYSTYR